MIIYMNHLPVLIQDLAVILISAAVFSLLFKILKQPLVLGYLVAGMLAGPNLFRHSLVSDTANISLWGEIGVIFLLFALGLEFSFKKLLSMGATSFIGALTIVTGMMSTGYITGLLLGWGSMNSLFLGGMLAMSSTTIVFKALDDLGLRNHRFANVVFGILIVEDLLAVVLMVLLSTVAVKRSFEGGEMAQSVIKLISYLLIWFVAGIFLIPTLLRKIKKYLNDETFLLLALGLCLGMVVLASVSGFSAALGAFVMGSILAETIEAENIDKLIKPVKDLFGAIFFVSVGMMINPELLAQYWLPIVIITLVVMFGQMLFASLGVLISGQPTRIAIQSGFSLMQIGEFAFIIASLGMSLKVIDPFLYPVVVAVSVITTFITPYMIRLAEPADIWVQRKMPPKFRVFLDKYASGFSSINHQTTWKKLLKALLKILAVYGITAAFITFIYFNYVSPEILRVLPGTKGEIVSMVIILLLISPFLRAIMMKKNHSKEFVELWNDNRFNKGYLVGLITFRIILCTGFVMFIVSHYLNLKWLLAVLISTIIIAIYISSKFIKKQSIQIERHFLKNLTAREKEKERKAPIRNTVVMTLKAKDIHLADFVVAPESQSVGKKLMELNFRQKTGVNVVKIVRGEMSINIPGGNEKLYPFDKIIVAGTDKQIKAFREFIDERRRTSENIILENKDVSMEQFFIGENSYFIDKTIATSGIRDKGRCLVVGIEREKGMMMNPEPNAKFEQGDTVWVAGERDKLESLLEEVEGNPEQESENNDNDWIIKD